MNRLSARLRSSISDVTGAGSLCSVMHGWPADVACCRQALTLS